MTQTAARVTRITEYGDKRLREEMAKGLMSEDVKRGVEALTREKDLAISERDDYRMRVKVLDGIRREDARRHIEAYGARMRERNLWRDIKPLLLGAAAFATMITITVMSVIAAMV